MTISFSGTTLLTHSSWAPLEIRLAESYGGSDVFAVGGYLNDGTTNLTLVLEGLLGACLENHELSSLPTGCAQKAARLFRDRAVYRREYFRF